MHLFNLSAGKSALLFAQKNIYSHTQKLNSRVHSRNQNMEDKGGKT